MARKCKKCPEKIMEIKNTNSKKERRFSFPTLWITVEAKDLEEAMKKIKALTKYKNKSI